MKSLFVYLMVLIPFTSYAQHPIKGRVTDISGQPLDAATIMLSKDSKNIEATFTDFGDFMLNKAQNGVYTLSVSLVGYKAVTRSITFPKDTVLILMQPDHKALKEVTVTFSKPVIERKPDRVIFNVENSIVASGGSAWDALSKAPGVQVTSSNSITANKKNVLIYLDGKPLHLSGDDLAAYLQGMPSDLLAKVEVFSNPPANFEAEGASVINIVTKKSKAQGFNATLSGSFIQANYRNYTASTTFNYRKDQLSLYGSYGYAARKIAKNQYNYVAYHNSGNYSYWDSPSYNVFNSKTSNYSLGADYQLSKSQIIGFLITGNNRTGNIITNTKTTVNTNFNAVPDSTLQTNAAGNYQGHQFAYNLNYNIKLDTSGQSFNIDLDYSPYKTTRNQYVDNRSFLSDGTPAPDQYHIYTPTVQDIAIYSAKMDYNRKLGKLWNFTSGLKYSTIKSQNNFDFYNNGGVQPILITENSNHFQYTENIAAAYISIGGSIGKWSFQGGLRGENTQTRGYSISLNSLNKKGYFKLFPTLYTIYKLDDDHELQFTYAYRIERPEYGRLNPAKHYTNPYNYLVGNPSLQPAFIQNIELGYTYKKLYNITGYYTATHDVFSNITVQDNTTKIFFNTHENLGLSLNTGIRLSASLPINDWWEMSNLIQVYYQREKSTYLQGSYDYHRLSYDGTTTQSFTLNKKNGIKAELIGHYNSPGIQVLYHGSRNYEVDAGIKATVLNGQGTIKLAANDIFYSNNYQMKVNYLNQDNGFLQKNDTRNAVISFSYRFGKNIALARKRTAGIDDEKQRAQ